MQRRDFVKKASAVAALGALAGCGTETSSAGDAPAVQTQPNVRWRLASSYTRSLDVLFGAAERLAERVGQLTDGRFQIRTYPAGELVPFDGVLDAVQTGTAQAGQSASYYYIGKNPALAFDTGVPFGLTARQHAAWMHDGGGQELLRGVFSDFGVRNFPGGNTGAQMGGWFRQPVESAADLRGLKMRIPGLGGRVMSELGVNVQLIGGGELYPALERGTIDAADWVGPYDDQKLGLHEVARYYHYPGWWEPGPALSFYVNERAWSQLPSAYQQAFEVATFEASQRMLAQYDARNPQALRELQQQGVVLHPFPTDVMQVGLDASTALQEDQAARDATYRQVYDAYRPFRDATYAWFGTAEQAYASFAYGGALRVG